MGNEKIILIIEDINQGKGDKRAFCKAVYNEVYALCYPVIREEEQCSHVTKRAVIALCNNIDKINTARNVHRQIATLVSAYLFDEIVGKDIAADIDSLKDYDFDRIKEDDELLAIVKENVKVFKSPKAFDAASEEFHALTPVQTVIMEFFAYELHAVDDIENMLNVDSAYIRNEIAGARAVLTGNAGGVYAYMEDAPVEDSEEEDETADFDEVAIEEVNGHSRGYHGGSREGVFAAFVGRIFPKLSRSARRTVVRAASGVLGLCIVFVLILSIVLGNGNKKSSNRHIAVSYTHLTLPTT